MKCVREKDQVCVCVCVCERERERACLMCVYRTLTLFIHCNFITFRPHSQAYRRKLPVTSVLDRDCFPNLCVICDTVVLSSTATLCGYTCPCGLLENPRHDTIEPLQAVQEG